MIRRKKLGAHRGRIRDGLLFSSIQSGGGGEGEGEDWVMDMEEDDHRGLEKTLESDEDTPRPKSPSSKGSQVWTEEDKAVYEQQLEHLHDQLTCALMDNQELKNELAKYKSGSIKSNRSSHSKAIKSTEYGSYHGIRLSTDSTREGFESISSQPTIISRQTTKQSLWTKIKDFIFEILYDFTDESRTSTDENTEDTPPLQAKKLKDNLQRLGSSSKPWREAAQLMMGTLQWKNPSLSLVAFLIYMYCVWNGWIIQLILLIAIIHLTLNYFHVIGLTEQFGFGAQQRTIEDDGFGSLGLSDKFQLIRQVGQTVQNITEDISNHLEKAQNLLLWHQPQATRKVYSTLCVMFLISLVLPNSYILTITGLFVGFKLFIVDNIYRKYPKVKAKYDGVAKMWDSLPTNAELFQRQSLTEEEISSLAGNEDTLSVTSLTVNDNLFCERFQLSLDEVPLENWQSGKRCSLINRERPLVGSKSGRMYLTHSHICFERSPRPNDNADRFSFPLKDIEYICKAKPFAVLPGSGMSIEVFIKGIEKPILFGAILHRDQAYQALCDQALILGLPWGTDPENLEMDPSQEPPEEENPSATSS